MEYNFEWQAEHLEMTLCIVLLTFGFLVFHFFYLPSSPACAYLTRHYGEKEGHIRHILLRRGVGILVYGIIPSIVLLNFTTYSWADYGMQFKWHPHLLYWIIGLGIVIYFLTRKTAKQADSLAIYPEIRHEHWSRSTLLKSISTWFCYLFAYELLYRGFLLFACVRAIGVWPAIAINCSFYAITHIPKGELEAIGAIPLGFLMCIVTLQTGTIWVAFFAHLMLSMTNLFFSLKYHPSIHYLGRSH